MREDVKWKGIEGGGEGRREERERRVRPNREGEEKEVKGKREKV